MGKPVLLLCSCYANFLWDGIWAWVGALWAVEWCCVGVGIVSSPVTLFIRKRSFEAKAN